MVYHGGKVSGKHLHGNKFSESISQFLHKGLGGNNQLTVDIPFGSQPESETALWEAAGQAYERGVDKSAAMQQYRLFVQTYGGSRRAASAQFMLGECYFAAGDFTVELEKEPDSGIATVRRARIEGGVLYLPEGLTGTLTVGATCELRLVDPDPAPGLYRLRLRFGQALSIGREANTP